MFIGMQKMLTMAVPLSRSVRGAEGRCSMNRMIAENAAKACRYAGKYKAKRKPTCGCKECEDKWAKVTTEGQCK